MFLHEDDYADSIGDGYSNEFQRAYAYSRSLGYPRGDGALIERLVQLGKFVAFYAVEHHCRFTDAYLGESRHFVGSFDTYAEASDRINERDGYGVAFPPTREAPAPETSAYGEDDIPF